ncbi:MAG: hypothetical protein SPH93_16480 [Clostridium sp.]|nr:hypothetical protein [Clostridium sp.]
MIQFFVGDKEKAIGTIDVFINMIRNTISERDEFITIEQKIEI